MTRSGVVVAVPARDEADLVGRCLAAVAAAAARVPGARVVTVVGLDRCTDATGELARAAGARTVEVCDGVGAARAAAVAHGLAALDLAPDNVWIACTDADSVVSPDWLRVHLRLAAAGADVVRGTVYPDPTELDGAALDRFWAEHTREDEHPYVYGANLGIAGEAYLALGGFGEHAAHEDRDLAERAHAAGLAVVSTAQAPVMTSARVRGRAQEGFAAYLASLLSPG